MPTITNDKAKEKTKNMKQNNNCRLQKIILRNIANITAIDNKMGQVLFSCARFVFIF